MTPVWIDGSTFLIVFALVMVVAVPLCVHGWRAARRAPREELLVWPCLDPSCAFTAFDDDTIRRHERASHPEFMRIFYEELERACARDRGGIA